MRKCGAEAVGNGIPVQRMISQFGADVVANAKSPNLEHCVHFAAIHGKPRIIYLLRDNGGEVDPREIHGETPLRIAIRMRKYKCVSALIESGASLQKAKESNHEQSGFDESMKEERTKTSIKVNAPVYPSFDMIQGVTA